MQCPCDLKPFLPLQVWKAEADNICGYEGTVLVGVKAAKDNAPQKEVMVTCFLFLISLINLI